jgi:hypothetical protein
MTAGAIAQAVLTDFADGENLVITPANFDDGPTIPFVAWNHQSVAEALTQLADYSEMHWWIAPDSQVYFKEREAVPAPWGIVDGDNQCQRLSIRESRENLNNAVYYRTTFGAFTDDPLPEFKNPSETVIVTTPGQTFFQTEMQIQEAIDIATEIPGLEGLTPQEIEQADGTEALFWYIPGDDGFSLTTGKTLPLGAQITFHYNRLGGDVIPVEDATAISERAAIEVVGSGRYELAVSNTAYTSRAAAEQRASMIIQQRRNTAMVIDGETMRKGLDVGQWLVVSTSNPPINDTFLVTSVTARAVLGTPEISFSFSGVNGNKLPNGWDFFTGLGDAGFGGGFGAGFQGAGMAGGGGGGGRDPLVDLFREIPIGPINGTNKVFYLTYTVKPHYSLQLILNQNTQYPSANAIETAIAGAQYSLEQNKITYTEAPIPGDKHSAIYWKDKRADIPSSCKPVYGTLLNPSGPLYAAIRQAWPINEGGDSVLYESRHGLTAIVNLLGAQWVTEGDCEDKRLAINGGYAYPATPPALPVREDGKLLDPATMPTIAHVITGPTDAITGSAFSVLIRFKLDISNNYSARAATLIWKQSGSGVTMEGSLMFYEQRSPYDGNLLVEFWASSNYEDWEHANSLRDGAFHTLIVTYESLVEHGAVAYLDGVELDWYTNIWGHSIPADSASTLYVASPDVLDPGAFLPPLFGVLDTVQIFNRVLTADEVAALTADPYLVWRA